MRGGWTLAAVALGGCWPSPTEEPALEPSISLLRTPAGDVRPTDAVELRWSAELLVVEGPRVDSAGDSVDFGFEAGPRGLVLEPLPRWPSGAVVRVDLEGCLQHPTGEPVELADVEFSVVAPPIPSPEVVVRRPVPGELAPANLAWLLVAAPSGTELIELESDRGEGAAARSLGDSGPSRVFVLDREGPCSGLCGARTYTLLDPQPVASGPRGRVRTGTVVDLEPPRLIAFNPATAPGVLGASGRASEIVRVFGRWTSSGADGRLVAEEAPHTDFRVRAEPPPPEGQTILYELVLEDMAGARTATAGSVYVPPTPRIVLSELVPTPRRDWGDSGPNGRPFDPWPGTGAVSSADEWVELVNLGEAPVDLGALPLEIRALDGSPAVTHVADAPALYFGDGGEPGRWRPGEALVVRTRGDMAQRDLALELWSGSRRLDRIVLGTSPEADHRGGSPPDLRHEALARTVGGTLRWCEPTPGDPVPGVICHDD